MQIVTSHGLVSHLFSSLNARRSLERQGVFVFSEAEHLARASQANTRVALRQIVKKDGTADLHTHVVVNRVRFQQSSLLKAPIPDHTDHSFRSELVPWQGASLSMMPSRKSLGRVLHATKYNGYKDGPIASQLAVIAHPPEGVSYTRTTSSTPRCGSFNSTVSATLELVVPVVLSYVPSAEIDAGLRWMIGIYCTGGPF